MCAVGCGTLALVARQIPYIQMRMCDGSHSRSDKRNNKYTLMRAYIITSIQLAAVCDDTS